LKLSDPLIRSNFASHPWTKLLDRRDQYDTVLYQMGNSNFHVHMLDLVREFPGVVVMHDFYLSNLAFVMEVWNGQKDAFLHHIDRSHGLLGMIDFVQHGMDQARWEWLMNWEVLRKAQEIIVHSNHQILLLDRFYKFGWRPLPTMIRQPHKAVQEITPSNKQAIKKELGIDRSKFVFCSFGFLADTKLNLLTLEAFANSRSSGLQNANLVFVGELDRGEYGRQVLDAIQELGLTKQTQITGYVDDETYRKYLRAADAAIQLRTHSRGETSRAVLDCLAHGIPTIVNNHGSLEDYSAEVMVKLPEIPASNHLSQAIVRLYQDESFRAQLGQRAREEIVENHTQEKVAEQYAEIIHRAVEMGERKLFSPLISTLINIGPRNVWLRSSAQLAAANLSLRCQPRILIDVSDIAGTDWRGGIQRVVKNLVKELFSQQDPSIHLELIRLQDGELVRALRFAEGLLNLPENSLGIEAPVSILPGDSLFMLDASWSLYDQFLPIYERIRQHGGKVITLVYDLIPLKFPENCAQVVLDVFEPWLQTAIVQSDELVGISQAVVDDVIHYIHDRKIPLPRKLDLAYVHLGADIPVVPQESTVRAEVHKIVETSASPLFLMVGTVEPRKGHAFALDAFDHLWGQGMDYRLCIVGKLGWNVAEVEARIRNHPEFGKRLFFVENGSDAEINLCYSAATALVFPSSAEGFGLPIVEAALHQVPTLASDIPVLREVGGDGALYFSLEAPACLAEAVINMASLPPEMRFALAKKVNVWTWKESASNFLEILQHKRIYKEIS
jgi:glycosyltransferase involved in cell wall biosynthesis